MRRSVTTGLSIPFSCLVSQNEGVPFTSLMLMYGVIQSMNFYLRKTFSDSVTSYGGGGEQSILFQGSCQENGASPTIWLIITIYVVLLMKEAGHTSTFCSPISRMVLTLVGFIFVEDILSSLQISKSWLSWYVDNFSMQ